MASKSAWAVLVSVAFAIVLTATPIPTAWRAPVVAAAWTFFAASLLGWVWSEKRALSPIEKRERSDALTKTGNVLKDKCLENEKITFITKFRTKCWLALVNRFVKHNFSMSQYDQFAGNSPRATTIFHLELAKTKAEFPENFEYVYKIFGCLEGLERLRNSIRD
jgi:hypothetical protein